MDRLVRPSQLCLMTRLFLQFFTAPASPQMPQTACKSCDSIFKSLVNNEPEIVDLPDLGQ